MEDVIANNLREIDSLNQRGGRMLTVVDLIEDGTLDVETSGLLLSFVGAGASFLTAAGPGGVGKTTLMAVLLSFLPPDERIRTVTDPAGVPEPEQPTCWLCHEIGSGHWFGYLWGDEAAQFLALHDRGRVAGSLHADTDEEVAAQLLGPSVGAAEEDLAAVDLLLTMVRVGGMRRVHVVYESAGRDAAEFRPIVEWDRGADAFDVAQSEHLPRLRERAGQAPEVERATDFIRGLVERRVRHLADVLAEVAEFYGQP
jgi:type IV secretory pathway ATPase VirB11/archaellum biosynthesis ATPase